MFVCEYVLSMLKHSCYRFYLMFSKSIFNAYRFLLLGNWTGWFYKVKSWTQTSGCLWIQTQLVKCLSRLGVFLRLLYCFWVFFVSLTFLDYWFQYGIQVYLTEVLCLNPDNSSNLLIKSNCWVRNIYGNRVHSSVVVHMSADQGVTSSNLIGPLKSFIYLFLKVMCLDSNLCFVYLNLYFFWLVTIVCISMKTWNCCFGKVDQLSTEFKRIRGSKNYTNTAHSKQKIC